MRSDADHYFVDLLDATTVHACRMEPFTQESFAWPYCSTDAVMQRRDSCSAVDDALFGEPSDTYLQRIFQWEGACKTVPALCDLPVTSTSTGSNLRSQYQGSADNHLAYSSVPLSGQYTMSHTSSDMLTSTLNFNYVDTDNACFWDVSADENEGLLPESVIPCAAVSVVPAPASPLVSLPSALHQPWSLADASSLHDAAEFMSIPVQQEVEAATTIHPQLASVETPAPVHFDDSLSLDASLPLSKTNPTQPNITGMSSEVLILDGRLGLSAAKAAEIAAQLSSIRHQALNMHHCSLLIDSPLEEEHQSAGWDANRFNIGEDCRSFRSLCQEVVRSCACPLDDFDGGANATNQSELPTADLYNSTEPSSIQKVGVGFYGGSNKPDVDLDVLPSDVVGNLIPHVDDKSSFVPEIAAGTVTSAPGLTLMPCSLEVDFTGSFTDVPRLQGMPDALYSDAQSYWDLCAHQLEGDVHNTKPDSGASRTSSRMTVHFHHTADTEDAAWDPLDVGLESADKEVSGTLKHVTLDALQSVYDLPINEAAKKLGLGVTVLKKFCRKFDIPRWPYRKLKSLEKLENSLKSLLENSLKKGIMDEPSNYELANTLEKVQDYRQLILKDPSIDLEAEVKKWRQRNFKMEFKQRHTSL